MLIPQVLRPFARAAATAHRIQERCLPLTTSTVFNRSHLRSVHVRILPLLIGAMAEDAAGLGGRGDRCLTASALAADATITFANGKTLPIHEHDVSFRWPAEWEPHAGCWMAWPRNDNAATFRENAGPAKAAYVEVATAISCFEPVTVVAHKPDFEEARAALPSNVKVLQLPLDDSWIRDTGPTFVYANITSCPKPPLNALVGVDWRFNGWGGNSPFYELDDKVARFVANAVGLPYLSVDMVMEGGSIHTDGQGTLLTTEECLLNPNRNPHLTKSEIEERLKQLLGIRKIIWLPKGLYNDTDTNGHIDNFACFARPGVVLLAWTDDVSDPQHAISVEALDILSAERDACGRALQVIKLPCPKPLFRTQQEHDGLAELGRTYRPAGERLAASYANFYIANGGIIMPGFQQPEDDERAAAILREVFPDRQVVMVQSSREIVLGGGNIHCITQQQPAAPQCA